MDRHGRPPLQRAPTSGSFHGEQMLGAPRESRNKRMSLTIPRATSPANRTQGRSKVRRVERLGTADGTEAHRQPQDLLKAYHTHAHTPSMTQRYIHTRTLAITITAIALLATGHPLLD